MSRLSRKLKEQKGIALFYTAALMTVMLACMGAAIDLGRGYVVRMHLSKAVDGAALAAARRVGVGSDAQAIAEAQKYFSANFPDNYLGTQWPNPSNRVNVAVNYDEPSGSYTVNVDSQARLETGFMKVAHFSDMTVAAAGEATTRLVDLSFVVDKSGSLGSVWPQVQAAAIQFIDYFDESRDRVSLTMYSTNTTVFEPINTTGRGFSKANVNNHINSVSSGGNTATSEGLYQGWNQLRLVPFAEQSGMRVIVLFTDGSPNTFAAQWNVTGSGTLAGAQKSSDFPRRAGVGTDSPRVYSLYQAYGTPSSQSEQYVVPANASYPDYRSAYPPAFNFTYDQPNKVLELPNLSFHVPQIGTSSGIPTSFSLYNPAVNPTFRALDQVGGVFPNHPKNANNAARNLLEIIANQARDDASGRYRIRIYTLGLGAVLNENMGAAGETGSSIMRRVSNEQSGNPFYDSTQLEGKYYFAGNTQELNAAFREVAGQITRLSK